MRSRKRHRTLRSAVWQRRAPIRTSGISQSALRVLHRGNRSRPRLTMDGIEPCIRTEPGCATRGDRERCSLGRRSVSLASRHFEECKPFAVPLRSYSRHTHLPVQHKTLTISVVTMRCTQSLRSHRRSECEVSAWRSAFAVVRWFEAWRSDFARFAGFVATAFAWRLLA